FSCRRADAVACGIARAQLDPQVAAFDPAELGKDLAEGSALRLRPRSVLVPKGQPADPPHAAVLLRACCARAQPRRRGCSTTKKGYEFAPSHFALFLLRERGR